MRPIAHSTKEYIMTERGADSVIVRFPGGHVEVARTSEGTHWAHITLDRRDVSGRIVAARVDHTDKDANQTRGEAAALLEPEVYHIAVCVAQEP